MARPRTERGGSTTLDEATKDQEKSSETTEQKGAAEQPQAAPASEASPRALPQLPTAKTTLSGILEEKTVLVYGEPGIGKSTLASEWAGGNMFFFDCAGELTDLEIYRGPVTDWKTFREWGASYVQNANREESLYRGCVIDTADKWAEMCSTAVRAKHGIQHESDLDWGKGWDATKREASGALSKLMVSPGGVLLISHSKEVEIRRRRQEPYTRMVPTLTGGVREAVVNAADLILFIDWAEDGESRIIYTKPDPSFEAKERSQVPRLPKAISWPIGQSGWDVLKAAWG